MGCLDVKVWKLQVSHMILYFLDLVAFCGMHNIVDRPIVVDGKIEIRPIMYVALSYDHRIIDGRESVGFLCRVKECLENPKDHIMNGDIKKYLDL